MHKTFYTPKSQAFVLEELYHYPCHKEAIRAIWKDAACSALFKIDNKGLRALWRRVVDGADQAEYARRILMSSRETFIALDLSDEAVKAQKRFQPFACLSLRPLLDEGERTKACIDLAVVPGSVVEKENRIDLVSTALGYFCDYVLREKRVINVRVFSTLPEEEMQRILRGACPVAGRQGPKSFLHCVP